MRSDKGGSSALSTYKHTLDTVTTRYLLLKHAVVDRAIVKLAFARDECDAVTAAAVGLLVFDASVVNGRVQLRAVAEHDYDDVHRIVTSLWAPTNTLSVPAVRNGV